MAKETFGKIWESFTKHKVNERDIETRVIRQKKNNQVGPADYYYFIFVSYFTSNSQTFTITAQLPGDGSRTGTYNLGSRTYEWEANSLSFSSVSAWTKQGSSIFASTANNSANDAYPAQTLINNVQNFTKVTVS